MNPNIKVLSRAQFKKFLIENDISDYTISDHKNLYLISINDTYGDNKIRIFNTEHNNLLLLHFDDCDKDEEYIDLTDISQKIYVKAMTEEQAELIYQFVSKIPTDADVIVHCTMGQSRSGAVGAFIADYFHIKWEDFKKQNSQIKPNSHISSSLRKYL